VALMVEPTNTNGFTTPLTSSRERARRLGTLLATSLDQRGISREDFASRLGIDTRWVDALVGGIFPLSQIDDDLLGLMAHHLSLSEDALRGYRDAPPKLPTLPDDEPEEETASSRQDIFALLRDVQDEFSADGQDARRTPPPHLSSITNVLNEIREGEPVEPPHKDNGPLQLRRIDDTLKSFQDDGGEEDA
jgi:hypothetical protein